MCAPGKHAKPPMALIATESTTCGLVFRAAGERPVTAPCIGAQVVLGVLRVREGRFHSPRGARDHAEHRKEVVGTRFELPVQRASARGIVLALPARMDEIEAGGLCHC